VQGREEEEEMEEEEEEEESEEDESGEERRGGPSSSASKGDLVYHELIERGAVPAIVGKKRRRGEGGAGGEGSDEVEMELFTREAAKKARLIRDDEVPGRGGRGYRSAGSIFDAFFGGF